MNLQLNRKGVALGLVVGLLGGAAGGALATSGGSKTTTTTTTPSATRQARVDAFLSDLAGRLKVSVDTLKADIKAAAVDQVNAAVKDGTLTQAQADKIIAAIDAGKLGRFGLGLGKGPGGPGFGPGFGHHGVGGMDVLGAAAAYLGLTEAQLQAQLASGKSLADVAGATSGKSVSALEDAIVAQITKAVNANTNLTADQKAQILANLKTKVDAMVQASPRFGPRGGMHMQGGFRGGPMMGGSVPIYR
jgi:hypothetical protein